MKGGDFNGVSSSSFASSRASCASSSEHEAASYWLPDVMLCLKPFRSWGAVEYGCGQCLPCRLNYKRAWIARLMLEAQLHPVCFFVTLTYNKENLPCTGSVSRRDVQLWLKRLRKAMAPVALRYYVVGEYGGIGKRPHYHAVLFVSQEGLNWGGFGRHNKQCPCLICQSWQWQGIVFLGTVTPRSVSYVVEYTVKRMTAEQKKDWPATLETEFALMSRKPAIGAGAVESIAEAAKIGGQYSVIRIGRKLMPLARTLKDKVRDVVAGASPLRKYQRWRGPLMVSKRQLERASLLASAEGRRQHEERRQHSADKAVFIQSISKGKA